MAVMLTCVSMGLGRRVASGSGYLSGFGSHSRSRTFTIFPTTSTTGHHLGFERDYKSHTTFRGVLRLLRHYS